MLPKDLARRNADLRTAAADNHRVPAFRQVLNVLGCALAIPVYYLTTVHSRYPVTLDILITIVLTELNRYMVEGHRIAFHGRKWRQEAPLQEKNDWGAIHLESQAQRPRLECIAAIVGWREDPALYGRGLESYKSAKICAFLLAGIDGDEEEDQDMVKVFTRVSALRIPGEIGVNTTTDKLTVWMCRLIQKTQL